MFISERRGVPRGAESERATRARRPGQSGRDALQRERLRRRLSHFPRAAPDPRRCADSDSISSVSTRCHGAASVPTEEYSRRERLNATREVLAAAIEACTPGRPLSVIPAAIGHALCSHPKAVVVPNECGHGIDREFHMHPLHIAHHLRAASPAPDSSSAQQSDANADSVVMQAGMALTLEPALALGSGRVRLEALTARLRLRGARGRDAQTRPRRAPDADARIAGAHARWRAERAVRAHDPHREAPRTRSHYALVSLTTVLDHILFSLTT